MKAYVTILEPGFPKKEEFKAKLEELKKDYNLAYIEFEDKVVVVSEGDEPILTIAEEMPEVEDYLRIGDERAIYMPFKERYL
ncbi:hypothetical protein [Pyrococcus kukulkanii]|uniref:DUF5678 domain-containing protein n=1 Tax=Pyrococcus kukulkanii TaxID=1609559 RepID=A0ABV4T9E4_9EURY